MNKNDYALPFICFPFILAIGTFRYSPDLEILASKKNLEKVRNKKGYNTTVIRTLSRLDSFR